jgi:hypothetical protein
MTQLNFNGPINSLSLGNVSVNFLRELHRKGVEVNIYAINDKLDFSAFNFLDDDFKSWANESSENKLKKFNKNIPTLKVWHIKGSEMSLGTNQFLYTFYEVDEPTEEEINIVKSQKHVFFSSSAAAEIFKSKGCKNVSFVPLGLDEDFKVLDKEYLSESVIHFGLVGKFEKRKNTAEIINTWLSLFGNNPKYLLTCLVANPFIPKEKMQDLFSMATGGKAWKNLNLLVRMETNEEVNDLTNAIDIDLSGLSNGEGWNLPAFNATALGKWSIVLNSSSHKDWATSKNSILIEPDGRQDCYDNLFFIKGYKFNQGKYSKIERETIKDAIKKSVDFAKTKNEDGLNLSKKFNYSDSIDKILETIKQTT